MPLVGKREAFNQQGRVELGGGHAPYLRRNYNMNAVYEQITQQIIDLLESGTVPWRCPWKSISPRNVISCTPYRGINQLLLTARGFSNPYWLTYKQAVALGGYVRKGERGTRIIYYESIKAKDDDDDGYPMLRTYVVFNAEQCDNVPTPDISTPPVDEALHRCAAVVAAMPAKRAACSRDISVIGHFS